MNECDKSYLIEFFSKNIYMLSTLLSINFPWKDLIVTN